MTENTSKWAKKPTKQYATCDDQTLGCLSCASFFFPYSLFISHIIFYFDFGILRSTHHYLHVCDDGDDGDDGGGGDDDDARDTDSALFMGFYISKNRKSHFSIYIGHSAVCNLIFKTRLSVCRIIWIQIIIIIAIIWSRMANAATLGEYGNDK